MLLMLALLRQLISVYSFQLNFKSSSTTTVIQTYWCKHDVVRGVFFSQYDTFTINLLFLKTQCLKLKLHILLSEI